MFAFAGPPRLTAFRYGLRTPIDKVEERKLPRRLGAINRLELPSHLTCPTIRLEG